ncbi:MAG: ABC transporter substrate-binding protein [Sellimonas intestinalis]
MDPYQIQDDNAFNVSYAVTEPLFRIAGEDGKDWEPGLATELKENEDATVYTVTLRENAKWSDGTPITAEDVVYSFQRVVDQVLRRQRRMTTSI